MTGESARAVRAVIGLGSNVGDRRGHLVAGVRALRDMGTVLHASHIYETEPVGAVAQPSFLNAVVTLNTVLEPNDLLRRLLGAELARGRVRELPGGPRTLDLDLLFYGDLIVRRPGLTIPHPRWKARAFVCIPLLEILPALVDPESGLTVDEWCRTEGASPQGVERCEAPDWAS